MEIKATKDELLELTEFQKSLHFPSFDDEPLSSKFYREYIKTTWYCSTPMPLKSVIEGDEFIYSPDPTFHYLMYSYLRFMLPPIKIKNEYRSTVRIAWCHNIGNNIIKFASLSEDDLNYQSFDHIWLDDYDQYYMLPGAGKRRNFKMGVGSVPMLEEWSASLPAYPINVDQPWFYGDDTSNAFPIFYRNSLCRVKHHYVFRRKISDLLRMQIYNHKTDVWDNVHPLSYMHYLNYGRSITIQNPTLWGKYALITDQEIDTHKCRPKRDLYIRDVEMCDLENPNMFRTTAVVPIQCKYPCLAMFWKAENLDATNLNNYSNYTCNTEDLYAGWSAISNTSLKHINTYKFKDMDSDHFNIGESRKHFPSSPSEPGYQAYSPSWNSGNYHGEVGTVLKNSQLICKIANNDLYSIDYKNETDIDSESEYTKEVDVNDTIINKTKFMMRVRLLVIKKLTISKDDSSFKFSLN